MRYCEHNRQLDYVLGLAKNSRLIKAIETEMAQAQQIHQSTQKPARVFKDFRYRTKKSWSCERRVVGKAEYLAKGNNPRFIVTSISSEEKEARKLYEDFYCARGDMENRIKEQQLGLFADRTSTSWLRSNQLRLYFSSFAYVLVHALRRLGLEGTELGSSSMRYDSTQIVQGRSPSPSQRAQGVDLIFPELSLSQPIPTGLCPTSKNSLTLLAVRFIRY